MINKYSRFKLSKYSNLLNLKIIVAKFVRINTEVFHRISKYVFFEQIPILFEYLFQL